MHKIEQWTCYYGDGEQFDYYIKRNTKTGKGTTIKLEEKIEKARKFFDENGFMDFTRFCGFLKGCRLSLAAKIELYKNNF